MDSCAENKANGLYDHLIWCYPTDVWFSFIIPCGSYKKISETYALILAIYVYWQLRFPEKNIFHGDTERWLAYQPSTLVMLMLKRTRWWVPILELKITGRVRIFWDKAHRQHSRKSRSYWYPKSSRKHQLLWFQVNFHWNDNIHFRIRNAESYDNLLTTNFSPKAFPQIRF